VLLGGRDRRPTMGPGSQSSRPSVYAASASARTTPGTDRHGGRRGPPSEGTRVVLMQPPSTRRGEEGGQARRHRRVPTDMVDNTGNIRATGGTRLPSSDDEIVATAVGCTEAGSPPRHTIQYHSRAVTAAAWSGTTSL
jgi:hypothetical protein